MDREMEEDAITERRHVRREDIERKGEKMSCSNTKEKQKRKEKTESRQKERERKTK